MNDPLLSAPLFWEGHWGDLRTCGRVGVPGCQGQGTGLDLWGMMGTPSAFPLQAWASCTAGAWLWVVCGLSPRGPGEGPPAETVAVLCPPSGDWAEANAEDRTPPPPTLGPSVPCWGLGPGGRSTPMADSQAFTSGKDLRIPW